MENKSSNLIATINTMSKKDQLDIKFVDDTISVIQRRFRFPLKDMVVNDLINNKNILIFNPIGLNLPNYIPIILYNRNNDPIALINMNNVITVNKNKDYLVIDPIKFYSLCQTGSIALKMFTNWKYILLNQDVNEHGAICYSAITTKILDKMYAINLDPLKSDKFRFLFAKFFLLNIMTRADNETTNNIACKCCVNTDSSIIKNFDIQVSDSIAYNNFIDFIKSISDTFTEFSGLKVRDYMYNFIKMYGTFGILGLEYLPYFMHMVFSVNIGANFGNNYVIENLLGNKIEKYYLTLCSLIKNF